MKKIAIYDATLREGMQSGGASFTVEDKVRIAQLLDDFGISYIEAGNPGSNPKDQELYKRFENIKLKNAKLVAFGSTCRVGSKPEEDENIIALLNANTPTVAIFGKSWDFHATEILGCTLEENLRLISDSVKFFKDRDREVIYDAEHFFDGYKNNPEYAMNTLKAAYDAGADWLCLCDTNGGCFPFEIEEIIGKVIDKFGDNIGIHCHNDTGMAAANTVVAVRKGAHMAQVTLHGWGERCGNADICTIVPDLQLKLGYSCVPEDRIKTINRLAAVTAEMINIKQNKGAPYVGQYAFSHKGGMHIDAVLKNPKSFEHIEPELVGAQRTIMLSEVTGKKAVITKIQQIMPGIEVSADDAARIVKRLKDLEFEGYQIESADASFELIVRKELNLFKPHFTLIDYKVVDTSRIIENYTASAIVNIIVDGTEEITAANGNGPVDALDRALRRAIEKFYPEIRKMHLIDYKVRVLDSRKATASKIRVLIECSDGENNWITVGVSDDVIEASWIAMVDALEYLLTKTRND